MFTNPSSLNLTEKDMEFWELVLTKFITQTPLGISVFSWVEKSKLKPFYLWTLNPLIKRKWFQWLFETNSFIHLMHIRKHLNTRECEWKGSRIAVS